MIVRAYYVIKGLNPFYIHCPPDAHYFKEVEVEDTYDMDLLKQQAKDNTFKGYRFVRLEIQEN